jgi:p-aminobenzoyl-glutamate transporter AbgT
MKISSLLSVAAVLVTASLAFVVGSATLYSVVPCVFVLLIAFADYGPKVRYRTMRRVAENQNLDTPATSRQPYRLAA